MLPWARSPARRLSLGLSADPEGQNGCQEAHVVRGALRSRGCRTQQGREGDHPHATQGDRRHNAVGDKARQRKVRGRVRPWWQVQPLSYPLGHWQINVPNARRVIARGLSEHKHGMHSCASPSDSTGFTTPGDAPPCQGSPMCTNSSTSNSAKPPSVRCGGKIVRCNVLAASATTLDSGACPTTALDANAPGVMAASVSSTISPRPWCTRASGPCRTGFS
jgi:hypothetical protein